MNLAKVKQALNRDKQSILDRITKYTRVCSITGCHIWTGAVINIDGYSTLSLTYLKGYHTNVRVHQLNYYLHNPNTFDESLNILHKCDRPICINSEHLFQGTSRENTLDMLKKNRGGQAKLTVEQVQEIRKIFSEGDYTHVKLAKRFNIDRSSVSDIVNRETWKTI